MEENNDKHGWNIDARSFEPRNIIQADDAEDFKTSQSDHRSNSTGTTQSSKTLDNGYMSFYNPELIAQLNNMTLTPHFDISQYMYMQSIPAGLLSNSQFPQNSILNNRLPGSAKSMPAIGPQNAYPYLSYNRINQPHSLISMPYVIQPTVPNMTNAAGRSRRNSCMVNKVFNTGDAQIDKHLTESYKQINPRSDFNRDMTHSRFFVIKSYTEEHVHRSIKYGEWCSTQRGNDILDKAYRSVQPQGGHVYLFFSVNSSGYFCGVAEMTSFCDVSRRSSHWNDDKWQGGFLVEWLYVKDVPNKYLKHIILEYNDNRPITNSRDATEIKPAQKGYETLRLMHEYHHNSSLFDDFDFYESRERETVINNVPTSICP